MRLLYTVWPSRLAGNCGGDLRLFFTTMNSSDWQPPPQAPAPGMWLIPPNAGETVTLPSGDVVNFSLYPVNNGMPGLLYLYGAIQVHTTGGQVYGSPIGQSQGLFVPGQPHLVTLAGRSHGEHYDIGFDLVVPWDGISADCLGHWFAVWR